jgi:hypothetical protein
VISHDSRVEREKNLGKLTDTFRIFSQWRFAGVLRCAAQHDLRLQPKLRNLKRSPRKPAALNAAGLTLALSSAFR